MSQRGDALADRLETGTALNTRAIESRWIGSSLRPNHSTTCRSALSSRSRGFRVVQPVELTVRALP
jgi:hypothetical protein